jgi:ATP-dependent helicase/nuclease subunit B
MRFRAWKALSYHNDAELSPDIAAQLFAPPLHASVTRIETFATCPFQHFARYGLRLREREEQDVTAMDLGNVFHQILERVVRRFLAERKDWCEADATVTDAMIREYAEQVGKELRGELMLSSARNKYLLKRIEKTVAQVVAGQRAAAGRGAFRPAVAELEFGLGARSKLAAFKVTTPAGREVHLRGKIDRVDVARDGNDVAVIDYKLASSQLALDRVYHGISLQLLTYLLVLQSAGEELFGKPVTPAAAFYVRLLRWLEDVDHPDEATPPEDPTFHLKVKPRGIFDGRCIERLDAELTTGASDVVQVFVNKDGQFGRADASDVADTSSFGALLAHVKRRIGELADQIVGGNVALHPYRINRQTPCPRCEMRSVCRFDASINKYHPLPAMKRTEVLRRVAEGSHAP